MKTNLFLLSDLSKIYVKNGQFVDLDGRIRLFRGINSVIKFFPWYDPKMLDPERHKQMGEWGFNAVRLGTMWSGVEPEQGQVIVNILGYRFYFTSCYYEYSLIIFRSMIHTLMLSKKL